MPAPVGVDEVRARARRTFDRAARDWAANDEMGVVVDVPLHPPTERAALADLDAVRAWVDAWRRAAADPDISVTWATRSWSRVGTQHVPERARVVGAAAIARVAGSASEWRRLAERVARVRALLDADAEVAGDHAATLRTHGRALAALDADDFERLLLVVAWLRANPDSGRLIRELPIRGVDTKWIEQHRGVVQGLHRARTGAEHLGLREIQPLVRMRALDAALAPGGLTDVSAPVDDLAALCIRPDRVLVVENLQTLLAMPASPGTVVLDGGGRRVHLIAQLPWAQEVTYWGDLDSHGFAILHQLRRRGVDAASALMDVATLHAHRDLWGHDPTPEVAHLDTLTTDEHRTLQLLSAEGNVRLEQERIPWEFAVTRLGLTGWA